MDIMGVLRTRRILFRANIAMVLKVHVTFLLQMSIMIWYNMIKQKIYMDLEYTQLKLQRFAQLYIFFIYAS